MKNCSFCGEKKSFECFSKNSNQCKSCRCAYAKERAKTKDGIVTASYSAHRVRSKKRLRTPVPKYTNKELNEWAFSQPIFHELYDKWVKSGHDKYLKPSFDRLDEHKGYSISNLQIVTWRENLDNAATNRRDGKNNKYNQRVKQYDLSGVEVGDYHSVTDAYRKTGVNRQNIQKVCYGERNTAGGFYWKYVDHDLIT